MWRNHRHPVEFDTENVFLLLALAVKIFDSVSRLNVFINYINVYEGLHAKSFEKSDAVSICLCNVFLMFELRKFSWIPAWEFGTI